MSLRSTVVASFTALAVGAAGLLAAFANHVGVPDTNDTRGRLDISQVLMRGQAPPRWRVTTFERWKVTHILDVGFGFIHFDTFGSDRFDYYALVRSNGFRLKAKLYRDRLRKRDLSVSKLRVGRTNKRNFVVRVPLRHMRIGGRRRAYRWAVQTAYTSPGCRNVCFDFAPDADAIVEPLPLPAPTQSPTPAPTPSSTE